MMALDGKVILITGASRGIGRATAEACRDAGARVLAHASGPSAAATETAAMLGAAEDMLFEDLGARHAGFRLVEAALARAGRLDGVVNNAGTYTAAPLTGDIAEWDAGWTAAHAVNVQAPADICRAAIAHFRDRKSNEVSDGDGIIVNVASRAGHRGDGVENASYAASKGAVLAMTKTWARGLAAENILLYAIAPGWVETRMAPQDIAARAEAVKDIPLGRVAKPEEVAAMVTFLLSGASPSATGATFDINGASYVR